MLSGIYSAATALQVAEMKQEILAHNLAHVNVPGFRKATISVQAFESALQSAENSPQGAGSVVVEVATNFSDGPVVQTVNMASR